MLLKPALDHFFYSFKLPSAAAATAPRGHAFCVSSCQGTGKVERWRSPEKEENEIKQDQTDNCGI